MHGPCIVQIHKVFVTFEFTHIDVKIVTHMSMLKSMVGTFGENKMPLNVASTSITTATKTKKIIIFGAIIIRTKTTKLQILHTKSI